MTNDAWAACWAAFITMRDAAPAASPDAWGAWSLASQALLHAAFCIDAERTRCAHESLFAKDAAE